MGLFGLKVSRNTSSVSIVSSYSSSLLVVSEISMFMGAVNIFTTNTTNTTNNFYK